MDISTIQSGIFLIILVVSLAAMFRGEKKHVQSKEHLANMEDDMTDPGDLGSATGHPICDQKPSMVAKVTQGVAKVNIKKNAEGVIDHIKGIPLSVIPDSTIGNMTKAIREYTANKANGIKMGWGQATAIAEDVKRLYHERKKAGETIPDPEQEAPEKGKTDVNAA